MERRCDSITNSLHLVKPMTPGWYDMCKDLFISTGYNQLMHFSGMWAMYVDYNWPQEVFNQSWSSGITDSKCCINCQHTHEQSIHNHSNLIGWIFFVCGFNHNSVVLNELHLYYTENDGSHIMSNKMINLNTWSFYDWLLGFNINLWLPVTNPHHFSTYIHGSYWFVDNYDNLHLFLV